jgi:hypothetical protein
VAGDESTGAAIDGVRRRATSPCRVMERLETRRWGREVRRRSKYDETRLVLPTEARLMPGIIAGRRAQPLPFGSP